LKKLFDDVHLKIDNMCLRHLLLIWVLLICPGYIFSQTNTNDDLITNQQLWIDLYPHYYINEKLEFYGDTGYRTILNGDINWHRIYARPSGRYHFNERWEVHSGLGVFYIFNENISNRFEITPWQGVQFNWPRWDKLKFKNLLRIEERISFNTTDWSSSFEFRIRLKISGRYEFKRGVSDKFWFIPFYAEGFFPINDDIKEFVRNQGRVGLGLGHNPSKKIRFSLIVNWQSSRAGLEGDFNVSDIAYQLKVRINWNRKIYIFNRNSIQDKN
jgi:hypothetical protein